MAVAVRAAAVQGVTGAQTAAVGNKPAGTANGDVLLATIVTAATATNPTLPTATGTQWALLSGPDLMTGSGDAWLYWKVASGEPATWTWTFSGGVNMIVGVVAVSGGSTGTPLFSKTIAGAGTTVSAGTVTTTAPGSTILNLGVGITAGANAGTTFTYPGACTIDAQTFNNVSLATNPTTAMGHDTTNQVAAGVTTARTLTAGASQGGLVGYQAAVQVAPIPITRFNVLGMAAAVTRGSTY